MTKILEYLGMDVSVMTRHDWIGVAFTVLTFIGMMYVYFMVFRPSNKDKYESQRAMALDDEMNVGDKK